MTVRTRKMDIDDMGHNLRMAVLAAFCTVLLAGVAAADGALPLFDAHIHYNRVDWQQFPPSTVLTLWRQAGVSGALVSSTPDDGTLKLYQVAPERVIPFLRPYRSPADRRNWFANPEVVAYVAQRLQRGFYRGIGEFHLSDGQFGTAQIKQLVELAAERDIVLHAHCDAATVRGLYALNPKAKILWAHAGMDTSAQTITAMLERFPTLMAELSVRQRDIAPEGLLNPQWRALFLRYPERFMVGIDTSRASRWQSYVQLAQGHRRWLQQLPGNIAEKIAHSNAERYFATGAIGK
jgi:hypothetical protein